MNTGKVDAAARVIHAAMEQGRQTAAAYAIALDSAQLLMSPEVAAEIERLTAELAQRTRDLVDTDAERGRLRDRVVELEQLLADAPIAVTLTEKAGAAADKLTRLLAPTQALREDDPNGLHHAYRLGRDLPERGGA